MRHLLHNLFVLFSKDLHKTKNSREEQREAVEHKEQCSQQNLDDVDVPFLFFSFFYLQNVSLQSFDPSIYTPIKLCPDCETLCGSQCGRWREKKGRRARCMFAFLISSHRNPAIDRCKYLSIPSRALRYLMLVLTVVG